MSILKSILNSSKEQDDCIDLVSNEVEEDLERGNCATQENKSKHFDKRILCTFTGYNRYEGGCDSCHGLGAGLRGVDFQQGSIPLQARDSNITDDLIKEFLDCLEKGFVVSLDRQKGEEIGGRSMCCMYTYKSLIMIGVSFTVVLIMLLTSMGDNSAWYFFVSGPILICLAIVVSCLMSRSKKKQRLDKSKKDTIDVIDEWNNSGKLPRGYFLALGKNFWKNANNFIGGKPSQCKDLEIGLYNTPTRFRSKLMRMIEIGECTAGITWYQYPGPLFLHVCVNVHEYTGNVSFENFPPCEINEVNEIY